MAQMGGAVRVLLVEDELECLAMRPQAEHPAAGKILSRRRVGRVLDLLDDMNQWGRPKMSVGEVDVPDLERTLNMGVGMVALVAPGDADTAVSVLAGHGIDAWVCGEVAAHDPAGSAGPGSVTLSGTHPA